MTADNPDRGKWKEIFSVMKERFAELREKLGKFIWEISHGGNDRGH